MQFFLGAQLVVGRFGDRRDRDLVSPASGSMERTFRDAESPDRWSHSLRKSDCKPLANERPETCAASCSSKNSRQAKLASPCKLEIHTYHFSTTLLPCTPSVSGIPGSVNPTATRSSGHASSIGRRIQRPAKPCSWSSSQCPRQRPSRSMARRLMRIQTDVSTSLRCSPSTIS